MFTSHSDIVGSEEGERGRRKGGGERGGEKWKKERKMEGKRERGEGGRKERPEEMLYKSTLHLSKLQLLEMRM